MGCNSKHPAELWTQNLLYKMGFTRRMPEMTDTGYSFFPGRQRSIAFQLYFPHRFEEHCRCPLQRTTYQLHLNAVIILPLQVHKLRLSLNDLFYWSLIDVLVKLEN